MLYHSSNVNGSLAAADRDGAADAHRLAYEKHCWQPSSDVHVGNLEEMVSDFQDVAIVCVADVIFRCVEEEGFFCAFAVSVDLFHCAMQTYTTLVSHPERRCVRRRCSATLAILRL